MLCSTLLKKKKNMEYDYDTGALFLDIAKAFISMSHHNKIAENFKFHELNTTQKLWH